MAWIVREFDWEISFLIEKPGQAKAKKKGIHTAKLIEPKKKKKSLLVHWVHLDIFLVPRVKRDYSFRGYFGSDSNAPIYSVDFIINIHFLVEECIFIFVVRLRIWYHLFGSTMLWYKKKQQKPSEVS